MPSIRILTFALAAAFAMPALAQQATFPSRPIKLVVPFPAGGGGDLHGRLLGQKMSETLKQPVVIENRAGANGNIGYGSVAKAAPDGYTVLLGGANLTMAPFVYQSLQYNVRTELAPVSLVARIQNVFTVRTEHPARTLQDLLAQARANPGKVNYASSGAGGSPHLSMEMLRNLAKADMTHVPYQGDQAAFLGLIGGYVDIYSAPMAGAMPLIEGGKLRPLAVTARSRSPLLPNVPTAAEAGVPGFELESWWGLFVPAGTPAPIVEALNAAAVQALRDPEVRQKLLVAGSEAAPSTAAELGQIVQRDLAKYEQLIKAANIQPQ
jgi:tripartite-type tricarboxylate transporter receptor subunit TctC